MLPSKTIFWVCSLFHELFMLAYHPHFTILISEKGRILGLPPRDKAAMLVVSFVEFTRKWSLVSRGAKCFSFWSPTRPPWRHVQTSNSSPKKLSADSLRKQPTVRDATTGFPAKWLLRNERRNSILMTCHYPDLGSAFDWSYRVGNLLQPIRSTTQT